MTARPSAAIAKAISKVLHDPTYADHARRLGDAIVLDSLSGALVHELEDLPVPVSCSI